MTDKERQKLCERLRAEGTMAYQAADQIERLAKRIAKLEQRDRDIANDIRALARWI